MSDQLLEKLQSWVAEGAPLIVSHAAGAIIGLRAMNQELAKENAELRARISMLIDSDRRCRQWDEEHKLCH